MARMRDACLASPACLAAVRKSAALISVRVIATSAISPYPRESMQTASIHKTGPKGIPLAESGIWAVGITHNAEQLTADQRWHRILSHAVRSWLGGRALRAPPRLMAPA